MKLPDGLYVCQECGCIRGTTIEPGWNDNEPGPWTSTCMCEGITCRHCGEGKVRRPISNYHEEGSWTHVPYFAAMGRCSRCGDRLPPVDYRRVPENPKRFKVLVDDNFRYGREDERWQAGEYDDYESALAHCKRIVEECLKEQYAPGMTAEGLHGAYKHFGEDPWIFGPTNGHEHFSAWKYAGERARAICTSESRDGAGGV